MSAVLFFIAALGTLAGAIGVVMLRNPFYCVLALVCHLIALAALFLLLRAEFVAAAQVVVYAGAVMVLYVFVVAYVGGGDEYSSAGALRVLGPLFAFGLLIELFFAMLGSTLQAIGSRGAPYVLGFGTPAHIGKLFLTTYLFPFEVASLLLMVAAVGAVVLARRRRGLESEDAAEEPARVRVPESHYIGSMAEGVGIRSAGSSAPAPEAEGAGAVGGAVGEGAVGAVGARHGGGW